MAKIANIFLSGSANRIVFSSGIDGFFGVKITQTLFLPLELYFEKSLAESGYAPQAILFQADEFGSHTPNLRDEPKKEPEPQTQKTLPGHRQGFS